jgi:hypothetical protein
MIRADFILFAQNNFSPQRIQGLQKSKQRRIESDRSGAVSGESS